MRYYILLATLLAAVYSAETKKCKQCVELDVDNAKGTASVNGVTTAFSNEMMALFNMQAKVDDNALCSAPADETCSSTDMICADGTVTMNYTMSTKAGDITTEMVLLVPMMMKGCLKKEDATCAKTEEAIKEVFKEETKEEEKKEEEKKEKRDTGALPLTMSMSSCKMSSCDSDGKNCEVVDEKKSSAATQSLLFVTVLAIIRLL